MNKETSTFYEVSTLTAIYYTDMYQGMHHVML